MVFSTLVSTADLANHLGDANWVICDCRHDLLELDAGRGAYAKGHIPGAHFLHIDDDLSGPKLGQNGRHPLPQVEKLIARLSKVGIDRDSQVIATTRTVACSRLGCGGFCAGLAMKPLLCSMAVSPSGLLKVARSRQIYPSLDLRILSVAPGHSVDATLF